MSVSGDAKLADALRALLASTPQPSGEVTEVEISAAGRVLSDSNADLCYVDRDDNWKIHGDEFRLEAKAALEAAAAARRTTSGSKSVLHRLAESREEDAARFLALCEELNSNRRGVHYDGMLIWDAMCDAVGNDLDGNGFRKAVDVAISLKAARAQGGE
ncbi:MAG: hypothetical protein VB138_00325 [Burkholderia sp.]